MATVYRPRTVIVASRDHLCANHDVNHLRGFTLNAACKGLNDRKECSYALNREQAAKGLSWQPLDIEDLHKLADSRKICPFYFQQDRLRGADLILMPYNYLIDAEIRQGLNIPIKNSIIIFDEAHNMASCCEDASSFTIDNDLLEKAIVELDSLTRYSQSKKMETSKIALKEATQVTQAVKDVIDKLKFEDYED